MSLSPRAILLQCFANHNVLVQLSAANEEGYKIEATVCQNIYIHAAKNRKHGATPHVYL
jgi:hypothetical protein